MTINPEQLHTYKTLFPVRRGQTTSQFQRSFKIVWGKWVLNVYRIVQNKKDAGKTCYS